MRCSASLRYSGFERLGCLVRAVELSLCLMFSTALYCIKEVDLSLLGQESPPKECVLTERSRFTSLHASDILFSGSYISRLACFVLVCFSYVICVYVCMYVCVYVYVCVCVYVCMYACMCVCMYVCVYVCVCVYVYICTCVYSICLCVYIYICICIYV